MLRYKLVALYCVFVVLINCGYGFSPPIKWWEVADRETEPSELGMAQQDPQQMLAMMRAPPGMRNMNGPPGSFGQVESTLSDSDRWIIAPPGQMRGRNNMAPSQVVRRKLRMGQVSGPPGSARSRQAASGAHYGPPGRR